VRSIARPPTRHTPADAGECLVFDVQALLVGEVLLVGYDVLFVDADRRQ